MRCADAGAHGLLDGPDEAIDFGVLALGHAQHVAIGLVAHESGDGEALSDAARGGAEAHALHAACECDGCANGHSERVFANTGSHRLVPLKRLAFGYLTGLSEFRHDLVGDVGVVIHLLHVIVIIERFDEFEHLDSGFLFALNHRLRQHGDFR